MEQRRRRILLAIQPAVLEGALAKMISASSGDEVVEMGRGDLGPHNRRFDAAVVSADLPASSSAGVVITLPDTRGSAGTGTVDIAGVVRRVNIGGAEQVVELLHQCLADSSTWTAS